MNNVSEKYPPCACQPDADVHCLTCTDEAIAVKVVRIDWKAGLALVEASGQAEEQAMRPEEIDIMLVEDVAIGDIVLAHGGVAIAHLEKGKTHERRGI